VSVGGDAHVASEATRIPALILFLHVRDSIAVVLAGMAPGVVVCFRFSFAAHM